MTLLGGAEIDDGEMDLEGLWNTAHILIGFESNVGQFPTKLHSAKRSDKWGRIAHPLRNHWGRISPLGRVLGFRGLVARWRCANRFGPYMASSINELVAFADSTGTWVRCVDDHLWLRF